MSCAVQHQPVRAVLRSLLSTTSVQLAKTPHDLWGQIPPELLRAIVEASPSPSRCYIQLLGISHAVRENIRGNLRELSVERDQSGITPDALAALIGPCKALSKLSFPFPEGWGDLSEDAHAGWADETFGGHTQLAVLGLPSLSEPVVERILGHLPGLVELTVSSGFDMSTRVLDALARTCPGLQVLRCTLLAIAQPDPMALGPLAGALKRVALLGDSCPERLAALVGSLSAVSRLKLTCCPPAALEPIASHLTALKLTRVLFEEGDLPGPWLCRLEALSLSLNSDRLMAPLVGLLEANRATLRRLTLKLTLRAPHPPTALVATLRAMPRLTRLDLVVRGAGCSLSDLLLPDLVDRLERLSLGLATIEPDPLHIASSRLQRLSLSAAMGAGSGLALDCPALVALSLNGMVHDRLTVLQCPRLRTLSMPAQRMDGTAPMPLLEALADSEATYLWTDPAWLLDGSSPRLRALTGVRLTRPDLLASLGACGSLVRLEQLHLDVTQLPNPLVLRLPGQLEHLDLHIEARARPSGGGLLPPPPLDLRVEAPGLVDFALSIPDDGRPHTPPPTVRVRLSNCPHLVRLDFRSPATASLLSVQLDEGDEAGQAGAPAMPTQPRSLRVSGALEATSLLGLLDRHGARLREVTTSAALRVTSDRDWPRLVGALSGLPRLARLAMDASGAPSPLSLGCPHLRTLSLHGLPDGAKVVLACPLLERHSGIADPRRQLVLALPAPNLDADLRDPNSHGAA
ncbi:hypothetical protein PAPYR_4860 [Paratrimastix pyriformis]|uniref:Uncharacterized protein n=1 Tax=Paratrimastix pyriformis TaxID=342808 RepID=A0ABQ8ULI7_9EUKA|nr:hypothetical protein PAPYR_4860 [Paratrimastix pyriformis]